MRARKVAAAAVAGTALALFSPAVPAFADAGASTHHEVTTNIVRHLKQTVAKVKVAISEHLREHPRPVHRPCRDSAPSNPGPAA